MESNVIKNKYGFFELVVKPTTSELKKYYADKYYQQSQGSYQKKYSQEEITYVLNKLEQKEIIVNNFLENKLQKSGKFLDVGAGEGWALKYFSDNGWACTGLDYSEYGCSMHNPKCIGMLQVGDIYENIDQLILDQKRFDLVLLDNVLEHVIEPLVLLQKINQLVSKGGVLVIEVPNDFSILQQKLISDGMVSRPFWVVVPDHISYFCKDGLINLCNEAGWQNKDIIGDFPIDFNLINSLTNYVENKSVGGSCHVARVTIENLLHSVSPVKTNALYRALGNLGMGRQLIGFFQKMVN